MVCPQGVEVVRLQREDDFTFAEYVWSAAHEPGPVEAWAEPVVFEILPGPPTTMFTNHRGHEVPVVPPRRKGFFDVLEGNEFHIYSERFRAALDARRTPEDRYHWLPVEVLDASGAERRRYWILNVEGTDVCRGGVVDAAIAKGRLVAYCVALVTRRRSSRARLERGSSAIAPTFALSWADAPRTASRVRRISGSEDALDG